MPVRLRDDKLRPRLEREIPEWVFAARLPVLVELANAARPAFVLMHGLGPELRAGCFKLVPIQTAAGTPPVARLALPAASVPWYATAHIQRHGVTNAAWDEVARAIAFDLATFPRAVPFQL